MKFHPSFISIGLMVGGYIALLVERSDPPGFFFGVSLIIMLVGALSLYATASSLGRHPQVPTNSPDHPGNS